MKIGKKEVSLIKLIIIVIVLIIAIVSIFTFIKSNKKKTGIKDFKSVQEIVNYLGSEYISESRTNSSYSVIVNLKFKYLPYNEDNTSNEKYYNQMISMIANLFQYGRNFILKDESNNIVVKVTCDRKTQSIANVNINDIDNYFTIRNNEISLDNFTSINNISININSKELNSLIKNNWGYEESLFGTKDSTYENYDIFFDEGINVRSIYNPKSTDSDSDSKVFNIVFTNKYKESIINNLNTNTSLSEVINILGQPSYGSIEEQIIGYKSAKFYIFFANNEVSLYRNENPDKKEFAKIVSQFITEKNSVNLISRLINIWPDYDIHNENKEADSKELVYSLYGVKVQFNINNEHGVVIYNDFSGNVTEDATLSEFVNKSKQLPKNIYIKNTSLIYENEMRRAFNFIDTQFMKQTDKFFAYASPVGSTEYLSMKFISKTDEYPNSELTNFLNTYEWADNVNLIYSVKNKGLYIYNVITKENNTIIEGNDYFNITKYENKILTYDNNKEVKVNI